MEQEIQIGGRVIKLNYDDIVDNINVTDEITIDYGNLVGEEVATPIMLNAIGILKAEQEKIVKQKELEIVQFESVFVDKKRRQAHYNNGKFRKEVDGKAVEVKISEAALKNCWCSEEKWLKLQNELFILENNLKNIENLYWRIQDKNDKLKTRMLGVKPEEMTQEMIEESINKVMKRYKTHKV